MSDQPGTEVPEERSLDPTDWEAFRDLSHRMLDTALDHVQGVVGSNRAVTTPDRGRHFHPDWYPVSIGV